MLRIRSPEPGKSIRNNGTSCIPLPMEMELLTNGRSSMPQECNMAEDLGISRQQLRVFAVGEISLTSAFQMGTNSKR